MPDKKKAVIIKYGFLGDSIVCIPFLVALRRTHSIDLITIDWLPSGHSLNSANVFKTLGLVDNIFVIKRDLSFLFRFLIKRYKAYDDSFNLLPSLGFRSNLFYRVIGALLAINNTERDSKSSLPEALDLLSLAPNNWNYKALLRKVIQDFVLESMDEKCNKTLSDVECKVIGVQPFSKMKSKEYNLLKFNNLLMEIRAKHSVRFVFLGTKTEYLCWNFELVEWSGNSTLNDLFVLVSRIDIYLGVDTGVMHIADIMEKKIVALFSDRTRDRNWYPSVSAMVSIHRSYRPCGGCNLIDCIRDNECLMYIDDSEVLKAVDTFLHE